MPIARIGYGTDFILKNQGVGINTDTTDVKLVVSGTTKADYNITGIATLTNYTGFANAEQNITGHVTLTGEHSSLGDIVVGSGSTLAVSSASTVCIGTLDSVCIYDHFTVPNGGTEDRQECPVEGTVRFNKDLNTLEFYNGVDWRQFTVNGASSRGICCGGETNKSEINYFNITTQGNALLFGELTAGRGNPGGVSSGTRGIIAGGEPATDLIQYFTIASQGNATDFGGNLLASRRFPTGCSSSTRGIFMGGSEPTRVNTIEFIEMATTGVDASDFGDLTEAKDSGGGGAWSNGIRGGVMAGYPDTTTIEVLTISSKGNATKFGDTIGKGHNVASTSNHVRAIGGGGNPSGNYHQVQYITMASEGNALYFGDLSLGRASADGCSNETRSVFCGGTRTPIGVLNVMDYVQIATQGNAVDFGDLTYSPKCAAALSDSHGGLGGY